MHKNYALEARYCMREIRVWPFLVFGEHCSRLSEKTKPKNKFSISFFKWNLEVVLFLVFCL